MISAISLQKRFSLGLVALLVASLSGCITDAKVKNVVSLPESFSSSGASEMPDKWWQVFNDYTLNELIDHALRENFSLQSTWSGFEAASALLQRENAALFPHLNGSTELLKELERIPGNTTQSRSLELGLMAEYEVDLFGRIRYGIEADKYRASSTLLDYRATALTLAAEVTLTWYRIAESRQEITLIQNQIEANEKIADLLKTRFGSGQIRTADILRQQQLLEATREELYGAESRLAVFKNQLAVLLGRVPGSELPHPPEKLPELAPLPATGLPAKLVERRPDVEAALHSLLAADLDMGEAVRDQFPQISLEINLTTLLDDGSMRLFENWARSFAADLAEPLIDAGQRRWEVKRTEAVKNQHLYTYGQTVLTAFREVEDSLVLEQKQNSRVQSETEQYKLAKQTHERLERDYLNGAGNYIDVLIALRDKQELNRNLLASRLLLLEYRIALYRALAGGFITEREERRHESH